MTLVGRRPDERRGAHNDAKAGVRAFVLSDLDVGNLLARNDLY